MTRSDIDEVHVIALRKQPLGMDAGSAADIEDARGRCWKMPTKDLLCPYELQSGQPARQPILLEARFVVRDHISDVAFHGHHGRGVPPEGSDDFACERRGRLGTPEPPVGALAER